MHQIKRRILRFIFFKLHRIRKLFYLSISTNKVTGKPIINQATIFEGAGTIKFGESVHLGYYPSPRHYEGSIFIESRSENASISIGDNSYINNNTTIIADKSSITIGSNALIGTNVEIFDSDFHNLDPEMRHVNNYECLPVTIGNNVFIGNNVKILKGVEIGDNSVIGVGSIVSRSIPANVIAVGIPAKIISNL